MERSEYMKIRELLKGIGVQTVSGSELRAYLGIIDLIHRHRRGPTIRELSRYLGSTSTNFTHQLVLNLLKKGLLTCEMADSGLMRSTRTYRPAYKLLLY